ncbi:hypothetical protein [Afipia felis]|uniref:Uncharacterized protein n=2 Tax=Afipia felis TaxID=1035 RepID=A0A380WAM9_AFIFE|nr:hypothetical protein [Afipia felis]EKS29261.1 hypothetical protein HMPREF9697_01789 [Afipia felis ATCC 53690]SUU77969.1 Uncharacterised protein [Afipia felis]SUU86034.1 Uncharacterised protein [Afipia felis]
MMEITAAAIIAAIGLIGGWVWRLSSRLTKQDGKIEAAAILAANASAKATTVCQDLNAHKEHVAAEYVSRDAMKEVTDAINRLGDRLDSLFLHFLPKPPG